MITLKMIYQHVQSKAFISLTIISMIIFAFIDFHELYIPFYYASIFPVVVIPFLIMNQNVNYTIQKNIYVEIRSKSRTIMIKRIIAVDFIIALVYVFIISLVGNGLLYLFGFGNFSVLVQYFILMMIWSIYFTCIKNLISIITENNSLANIITVVIAILLRTINQVYGIIFNNMFTTSLACLSSVIILILIYFYLKTNE